MDEIVRMLTKDGTVKAIAITGRELVERARQIQHQAMDKLKVQGRMEQTRDGKDIQLNPYHINEVKHGEREDAAPAGLGGVFRPQ